jgi:predicted acetyltransferase
MQLQLTEIGETQRRVLERLAQLYMYDFAEHAHGDVTEEGLYPYIDFDDFFARTERRSYLIRVDGKIAGFALAYRGEAFRDPTESVWWMDEFFVMRKFRRRGIGERVATQLFEELGGTWEVGQVQTNADARAFWRRVIGRFTGGDYEEFALDDERWRGTVQYFHVDGRSS